MATKIPSPSLAATNTTTDGVQYVIRKQAEIERQVADINARLTTAERAIRMAADRIEQLANGLGYPVNSIHLTRQQLHEIVAILRGVKHHG